jgi:hypothetical protein
MKKLCIAINGSMRLPTDVIINCINVCKNQFSTIDHDIWVFTWKTDDNVEDLVRPHVFKLIAEEPSPTSEDLDWLQIPYTQQLVRSPEHNICRISHYSTMYGLNYLFNEITKSGIEYEYALRMRNDIEIEFGDITKWFDAVENNPKAYVTPPMKWCPVGINDHVGLGNFHSVKNMWAYDDTHIKNVLSQCWNFEVYVQQRLITTDLENIIMPVNKYIVKRTGRVYDDGTPIPDWNLL